MRRVYQFGLRPPTDGSRLVREQIRAAHSYKNELTAIERGRRWALRQVDDTPEVLEAVEVVKAASKTERKAATTLLRQARQAARSAAPERLVEIAEREHELLLSARENTRTFWGSYLDVEAAHRQSRQLPLYGDDAIEPNDPKFVRWQGVEPPSHERSWLPESAEGQIGIQLQGGLSTADAQACTDTRMRLRRGGRKDGDRRFGELWLRVGSSGREPVWAVFPAKIHREIPDSATWKWVRVSLRHEGKRERWSCEITVDDAASEPRSLDRELDGAIAVEWDWSDCANGIRVARWADTRGETGEIVLPLPIVTGIRKPDGIRAVRDKIDNELRDRLATAIQDASLPGTHWLRLATATLELWKSPRRLYELAQRWTDDSAPEAKALLMAWRKRDEHLWDYESGARGQALRRRRDHYRCLAASWARSYRTVILSNQDLSREAQFGEDSDRRFTVSPFELRGALRNAFGSDAVDGVWSGKEEREDQGAPWCERARDEWMAGGASAEAKFSKRKEHSGNAWAERKAKAKAKRAEVDAARQPGGNAAE